MERQERKERRRRVVKKVVEFTEKILPLVKIWLCGKAFRVDEKTFSEITGMSEKEAFDFLNKQ